MYRLPKTSTVSFAASALLTAIFFSSSILAAALPPTDAHDYARMCDRNPNVNPSLRICASTRDGATHYRIDTVDGTHADVVISGDGVEMLQAGPDPIQVRFASTANGAPQLNATERGVTTSIYQDAVIKIDAVQRGQHPPVWVIHPMTIRIASPLLRICTGADCSGHFRSP